MFIAVAFFMLCTTVYTFLVINVSLFHIVGGDPSFFSYFTPYFLHLIIPYSIPSFLNKTVLCYNALTKAVCS
jgi:hypothetical protein